MSPLVEFVVFATVPLVAVGVFLMVNGERRRRREKRLAQLLRIPGFRQRLPDFERELNRARRAERKLSVVVLALEPITEAEPSLTRRVASIDRLAYLMIGSMLRDLLREHDIVAYDPATDRHVLQLTESDRGQAARLFDRIRGELKKRTSLALRGGIAQFPEDGLTLQELLNRAGAECGRPEAADGPAELDSADDSRFPARSRALADSPSGIPNSL